MTQYSQPTLQSQSTAPAQTPPPDVNGEQIVLFQPSVASTPVRTNQNNHVNRAIPSEPPIRTMLFPPSRQGPVTSNCNPGNHPVPMEVSPFFPQPTQHFPPDVDMGTSHDNEREAMMQKWSDSCSHIDFVTNFETTPHKEDCLLIFQCIVIMWCNINSYPSRLLKRFTVYDFVNMVDHGNSFKYVSVSDGNKYKYRTALKFNKFEYKVLLFYFKHIRPKWTNSFKLLTKESFPVTVIADPNVQEMTQLFFYNSNGNKQINVARVCENFNTKMSAAHKKPKRRSTNAPIDKLGASISSRPLLATEEVLIYPANAISPENDENVEPQHSKRKRLSHNDMMQMSPNSKRQIFYSNTGNISPTINAVSNISTICQKD